LKKHSSFPSAPFFEQDGRVVEAGFVADDIRWKDLPVVTVQIFPLIFVVCANAKARLEYVTIIAARFERTLRRWSCPQNIVARIHPHSEIRRFSTILSAIALLLVVSPASSKWRPEYVPASPERQ
jgi:hypothetical protein